MSLSLVVLVMSQTFTPPPMVSAPPTPPAEVKSAPTAEPAKAAEPDVPLWQVTALATATVPTALEASPFSFGLRGEVDVWRISALVTFDRAGTTPTAAAMAASPLAALTSTLEDARTWNGLLGYAVLLNHWARIRALGGVSALTTDTTSRFAPSLGGTARIGWRFLAAEAGLVFTPVGFRQLDARVEGILRGGIFELHVGYRARFVDSTDTGTLATLFASTPNAGPTVALGLSF